jgi:hypothetical protein
MVYLTLLILININIITKYKTHSSIKTHYFTNHFTKTTYIRKYNNITLKICFNFASKLYIKIVV